MHQFALYNLLVLRADNLKADHAQIKQSVASIMSIEAPPSDPAGTSLREFQMPGGDVIPFRLRHVKAAALEYEALSLVREMHEHPHLKEPLLKEAMRLQQTSFFLVPRRHPAFNYHAIVDSICRSVDEQACRMLRRQLYVPPTAGGSLATVQGAPLIVGHESCWAQDGAQIRQWLLATTQQFEPAPGSSRCDGGRSWHTQDRRDSEDEDREVRCVFIEVGVGPSDSLAVHYVNDSRWHGVSVEPLPQFLAWLPEESTRLAKVAAAIDTPRPPAAAGSAASRGGDSDSAGASSDAGGSTAVLYVVDIDEANTDGFNHARRGMGSLNPAHHENGVFRHPGKKKAVTVKRETLASVLAQPHVHAQLCAGGGSADMTYEAGRCRLDLLKIDTEGWDVKVLVQAIAFAQSNDIWPRRIKFEYVHCEEDEVEQAIALLSRSGYFCAFNQLDVACVLTTARSAGAGGAAGKGVRVRPPRF
eukprot:g1937.t1